MRKMYFGSVPEDFTLTRKRMEQRVLMHDELVCLALLLTELYWEQDMQYVPAVCDERRYRLIGQILGGPDNIGLLQNKFNLNTGGVLDRLQLDVPDLRQEERLIFSYSAAGFTNYLSGHLAGLSGEGAAGVLKSRLRSRIQTLRTPNKHEYLAFLPKRSCRIGEEMLYLHDK